MVSCITNSKNEKRIAMEPTVFSNPMGKDIFNYPTFLFPTNEALGSFAYQEIGYMLSDDTTSSEMEDFIESLRNLCITIIKENIKFLLISDKLNVPEPEKVQNENVENH